MELKKVMKTANAYLSSYRKRITLARTKEIVDKINCVHRFLGYPAIEAYMNDFDIGSSVYGFHINGGYNYGGMIIPEYQIDEMLSIEE